MERGWNNSNANLTNLVEPAFGRFVEILRAEPKPDRGLRALLGRLEELADYGFFDVVESPGVPVRVRRDFAGRSSMRS